MKDRKQTFIQLTLPLSRFDRRDIIRELKLPPTQKSILRELNDFAERTGTCFPSHPTLARCCGCCQRTIQTHLQALESAGLIIVEPRERIGSRGARSNRYAIVWEELAIRTNRTIQPNATDQTATVTDQAATATDQAATVADQAANSAPLETTREATRETTTETDWEAVVVHLEKLGVGKARDAITKAKARNATPNEVIRIADQIANDSNIATASRPGAIYNQVCKPTLEPLPIGPRSKPKPPDRENIRTRMLDARLKSGIERSQLGSEFESEVDRVYERCRIDYEKQRDEHKRPLATFAAKEPTR